MGLEFHTKRGGKDNNDAKLKVIQSKHNQP